MSTAAFALRAGAHFVISPNFFGEQEAVCQWLGERDIQVEHVRFIQGRSQDVLPNLEVPPLDAVLIDGGHAFPLPYIDWLFACRHLQPGGRLIIDDMHIRPCALLREFLEMEEGRWRLVADLGATVVFEKLTRRLLPDDDWTGQPWSVMSNRPDKRRRLRALLRHSA